MLGETNLAKVANWLAGSGWIWAAVQVRCLQYIHAQISAFGHYPIIIGTFHAEEGSCRDWYVILATHFQPGVVQKRYL